MKNKKSILSLGIIVLILFLGVGYAVVSSVYLNIGGTASVNDQDLNVEITNAIATSTINNKVVDFSHTLSNKNLTSNFTLNGMELDETVSITYTVTNREKDIDATLTLIEGVELTNTNNDYFESNFEIIDDHTDLANNDKTMIVLVTVKLIKTPVSEEGGSTTVAVSVNATPSKATIDSNGVTFNPENVSDYTLKATTQDNTSEFWGYKEKIKTVTMEDEINIPIGINEEHVWDVSESGNRKVMAFIIPNSEDSTLYDLYIQGDGGIYANSDSSYLFYFFTKVESINLDVFNTSNVTNMSYMFAFTSNLLNLNLNNFDTAKVTNMEGMFGFAINLSSLDVSKFNTSNVTNMNVMFSYAGNNDSYFTLNLGNDFDTSNVTDMGSMFLSTGSNSTIFTLDLGDKFYTNKVTDMSLMFKNTGHDSKDFILDLGDNFDTSNVTNMSEMFLRTGHDSTKFTLDLGKKFDTSNVTDMNSMFYKAGYTNTLFTINLGDKFNTSKVVDMRSMFRELGYNSTIFSLDLGRYFDTSNVTNMSDMFFYTGYNSPLFSLDCRNWNVSKVEYYSTFNSGVDSKVIAPSKFDEI